MLEVIAKLIPSILLKFISTEFLIKYWRVFIGLLILLFGGALLIDGQEILPHYLIIIITIVLGLTFIVFHFILSKKDKYKESDINKIGKNIAIDKLILGTLRKSKFQFISLIENNQILRSYYSHETLSNDEKKLYQENDTNSLMEIYNIMKLTSENINIEITKKGIDLTGNVLRFIYDIENGGAFLIGNLHIIGEGNIIKHIYVYGYTTYQKNVNKCAEEMGNLIDNIRLSGFYGDRNICRIINITNKKENPKK